MTVRSASLLALLALAACAPIRYEREVSPLESEAASTVPTFDLPLPRQPPMREAFTTYRRVLADTGTDRGMAVVGYAVRYDEPPADAGPVERSYPTGTVFLEDREFERIGFLTTLGRAYRYEGSRPEEVGRGTLEALLPKFFPGEAFELAPMGSAD